MALIYETRYVNRNPRSHCSYSSSFLKILCHNFKEPIEFLSLTIKKLAKDKNHCTNCYKKVCLVLDDDTDSEKCTDTEYGFHKHKDSEFITWNSPKAGELDF